MEISKNLLLQAQYNFACGFDFRKLPFFSQVIEKKVKFCRRVLSFLANLIYQFLSMKELNSMKRDFYDKRCLLKHYRKIS